MADLAKYSSGAVVLRDREIYDSLYEDMNLPSFLGEYSQPEYVDFLQGKKFTIKAQYQRADQFFCLVEGQVTFNVVHPIYRQEVYADQETDKVMKSMTPSDYLDFHPFEANMSPVNFAKFNEEKHKNFAYSGAETIELFGGHCLYVPALTWYQADAKGTWGNNLSNIMVDIVYPASSNLLLGLMSAVENRIIT